MAEPNEEQYWRAEIIKRQRGQLETVRRAATSWSALFGAVLGVFGTVAFAGGLTGLDDLAEPYRRPVQVVTIVAAGLAVIATVLAARSAGPAPKPSDDATWQGLRKSSNAKAERGLLLLRLAKYCGAFAAVLVVTGSSFVVLAGKADGEPRPPTVLVAAQEGLFCGPLTRDAEGSITVDGRALTGVTSVEVIETCP